MGIMNFIKQKKQQFKEHQNARLNLGIQNKTEALKKIKAEREKKEQNLHLDKEIAREKASIRDINRQSNPFLNQGSQILNRIKKAGKQNNNTGFGNSIYTQSSGTNIYTKSTNKNNPYSFTSTPIKKKKSKVIMIRL